MMLAGFSVTGSTANTVTLGGPCGACGHEQQSHSPEDITTDCPPMCSDCVASDWCRDVVSCKPAFHHYERTPVTVVL